jgi:hypothetical protein
MAILQIGRWKKIKIEKRRSSAALQNVAATSRSDLRLRLGVRRCSGVFEGKLSRNAIRGLSLRFCGRKNFLYALHHHRGSNLFHAGVTKRALAQTTVIAWRTW